LVGSEILILLPYHCTDGARLQPSGDARWRPCQHTPPSPPSHPCRNPFFSTIAGLTSFSLGPLPVPCSFLFFTACSETILPLLGAVFFLRISIGPVLLSEWTLFCSVGSRTPPCSCLFLGSCLFLSFPFQSNFHWLTDCHNDTCFLSVVLALPLPGPPFLLGPRPT